MNRRNFIKNSMLFAGSLVAIPSLIVSKKAYAAWPKKSFDIKDLTESVSSVYGHSNLATTLDNVESIMIFVENNPQPLSSGYKLTSLSEPSIGTRLKMGKTSNVMAAVKSGDKVYTSTQEVKVTIGGCGG